MPNGRDCAATAADSARRSRRQCHGGHLKASGLGRKTDTKCFPGFGKSKISNHGRHRTHGNGNAEKANKSRSTNSNFDDVNRVPGRDSPCCIFPCVPCLPWLNCSVGPGRPSRPTHQSPGRAQFQPGLWPFVDFVSFCSRLVYAAKSNISSPRRLSYIAYRQSYVYLYYSTFLDMRYVLLFSVPFFSSVRRESGTGDLSSTDERSATFARGNVRS